MIVLDVEASGVDPHKNSILSLGALDLAEPANRFYEECRVWDGAEINDEALGINGFEREAITSGEKQSEAELIEKFLAWAQDKPQERTLAGQNVSFDRDFVRAACGRAGLEYPLAFRIIDTHTLCWMHMTKRGMTPPVANHRSALNLDFALKYCGVPEEPAPHNALTGALCHAEVIARLAYNKKILPEFAEFEIPWLTT